jgi:adenylate kinase
MKMVLAAVPGAGKSTIMQLVQKELPETKLVGFGDVMIDIAQRDYGLSDRDAMRKKLSPEDYRATQEKAAIEISKLAGDVIIDTHTSIKTPKGYYPGLPDDLIRRLQLDSIVLLEFDPKNVLKRRKGDIDLKSEKTTTIGTTVSPRKGRELESLEAIEQQQQFNRFFAAAAANAAKCCVKIIDLRFEEQTPFEHAHTAAKELITLVKEP